MSEFLVKNLQREGLREALDWAVFSLGLVSLGIAVGATVLSKTQLLG